MPGVYQPIMEGVNPVESDWLWKTTIYYSKSKLFTFSFDSLKSETEI